MKNFKGFKILEFFLTNPNLETQKAELEHIISTAKDLFDFIKTQK